MNREKQLVIKLAKLQAEIIKDKLEGKTNDQITNKMVSTYGKDQAFKLQLLLNKLTS